MRRLIPFLLLGILTAGAGIGLGFGIAGEPSHSASGLAPTAHVATALAAPA